MNAVIYFLSVNFDIVWRGDSDANLVTFNAENSDNYIVTYHERFIVSSGQYEHGLILMD